jgi:hypothetical protein
LKDTLRDVSWKCLKCDGDNLDNYRCYDCKETDGKVYPSWSNVKYHIPIIKHFVRLISSIEMEISCRKYEKNCEAMDKKYGNYAIEDDDFKFIWGVKSWDDLSGSDCNMQTMNDIDIIYDKKKKVYLLGIETAFVFKDKDGECNYLRECLNAFTKYMDDNNLHKNESFVLFMSNPCTSASASTIEELYTEFRIFVEGFCKINSEK